MLHAVSLSLSAVSADTADWPRETTCGMSSQSEMTCHMSSHITIKNHMEFSFIEGLKGNPKLRMSLLEYYKLRPDGNVIDEFPDLVGHDDFLKYLTWLNKNIPNKPITTNNNDFPNLNCGISSSSFSLFCLAKVIK